MLEMNERENYFVMYCLYSLLGSLFFIYGNAILAFAFGYEKGIACFYF